MSSPATSCSRIYTESASTYCSRNRDVTIASRKDRVPRFSVYQLGRGSEPVIVVGSVSPAVAFSIRQSPRLDTTFRQYFFRLVAVNDRSLRYAKSPSRNQGRAPGFTREMEGISLQ